MKETLTPIRMSVSLGRVRHCASGWFGLGAATSASLLALLLPGCGPGEPEPGSQSIAFKQRDSAGIRISATRGVDARTAIGWYVDSLPDVELGEGGSATGDLYRVRGLKGLSGGGVLVVDGGSAELRFFDSEGRLRHRAGGRGRGPGEFEDPRFVPSAGDSLLFFDSGLLRFQLFSVDGEYRTTIVLTERWPAGRRPPVGASGLRVLVERGTEVGGSLRWYEREGTARWTYTYFWLDLLTGRRAALGDSLVFAESYTLDSGRRTLGIPFTARPSAAVGQDGAYVTDGREPEVREYDVEGRLRRILRVDEPARSIAPQDRERMLDDWARLHKYATDDRARFEEMPIPDTLPVYTSLIVDDLGWLWAELYRWDVGQPSEWMVFGPEGRARGTVDTPSGLDVRSITRDFILGVWEDEYDVEHVRRYPLDRSERQ